MRQSSVVGAQRARPAFPRVQKTFAEGADRNARCARRREKGCSEHESNRNCQTDRRPRARRYPEGDTPHNADTRGRPDADNIDTRCPILVCFDGFIQENWTEVKKTTYTYTSVRERSCCSIAYDELDRASEILYTVNDNESKAYASVLLACEGVDKRS